MTQPGAQRTYTLGQLAKQVGIARSSVLHYESLGLLAARRRSAAGYRLYGAEKLEHLQSIRRLRDAGLPLSDIRKLLDARGGSMARGSRSRSPSFDLLEKRLLELCDEVERIRQQQRLLARLLALPEFRGEGLKFSKTKWVALLRRAGLDDSAMQRWHVEFECASAEEHAPFLRSLGLAPNEIAEVRRRSRADRAAGTTNGSNSSGKERRKIIRP
jgi:DNA-binding transcriptional MerR regulator